MLEIKIALKETKKEMMEMKLMKDEIICIKAQNQMLSERITSQEDYSRRDNMLVSGLREVKDEVCRLVAQTFLKEAFDMNNVEIIRVHRLGGQINSIAK